MQYDSLSNFMPPAQTNFGQLGNFDQASAAPSFFQPGGDQFGLNTSMIPSSGAVGAAGGNWWSDLLSGMFAKKDPTTNVTSDSWGGDALSAIKGITGAYMGMKQYGLARDSFDEGKRRYNQDYAAQKTLTNGNLEDRQRARVASNGSAYQSVGDYMNKNGVV